MRKSWASVSTRISSKSEAARTLGDLLAPIDLGDLLLDELVTLLADLDDLRAGDNKLGDFGEDLLGDLGRRLVLGQSIRVVEGVVYARERVSCEWSMDK